MATHSRTLAWKTPWMEKPGGPQSMGSQRVVGHNWATSLYFTFTLPCLLLIIYCSLFNFYRHIVDLQCCVSFGCKQSESVIRTQTVVVVLVAKLYLSLLRSCGLLFIRRFCPWDFPGTNTRMGSHSLLQGIFLIQGWNLCLLHWGMEPLPLSHQGRCMYIHMSALFRFFSCIGWYSVEKSSCAIQ